MKYRQNSIKRLCCFLTVAMVAFGSATTGSTYAAAQNQTSVTTIQGQKSIGDIGVDITWYDFGSNYTYYSIRDDSGTGLYALSLHNPETNENKVGYVNGKGEPVLEPNTYDISSYNWGDEVASILRKGSVYHCITSKGIKTIDAGEYSEIGPFDGGYATVKLKTTWNKGVIDADGVLLFEEKSGKYEGFQFLGDGLFSAKINDKSYDLLDSSGKILSKNSYQYIYEPTEDAIMVFKDEKWGFLDTAGNEIVPIIYENASPFREGLAAVCKGGKYGFTDKTGAEVISPGFDYASSFYGGLASVSLNNKYGLIDKSGNIIVPLEYDVSPRYEDGFLTVSSDNKTLFFNTLGELVKTTDYSSVAFNSPNRIYVKKTSNGSEISAYLDKDGNNLTGFKEFPFYYVSEEFYLGIKGSPLSPGAALAHDYGQKIALFDSAGNNLTGFKYSNSGQTFNDLKVVKKYYYEGAGLVNKYGAELLPTIFDDILLTDEGYAFVAIADSESSLNGRVGYFKIPDSFHEMKGTKPITVYLDGVELYFDSQPVIVNQNTMVPMRKIFESLGSAVEWDNKARTVTAIAGNKTLKLTIGSTTAYIDGTKVPLDSPPFIQNDTTFVPLRFVSENLGVDVKWDNSMRRVVMTSK